MSNRSSRAKALRDYSHEMKRDWMRTAAYIGQVINSISKTYDEASVNAELKKLQKKIGEISERTQEGASQA